MRPSLYHRRAARQSALARNMFRPILRHEPKTSKIFFRKAILSRLRVARWKGPPAGNTESATETQRAQRSAQSLSAMSLCPLCLCGQSNHELATLHRLGEGAAADVGAGGLPGSRARADADAGFALHAPAGAAQAR